jgi:hypothetical protein
MDQEERYWACLESPPLPGFVTVKVLYVPEGQDEEV